MHDTRCLDATLLNRNMLVPWWMMATYAYETFDPILSDGAYDELCQQIELEFDDVVHYHKHMLDRTNLKGRLGMTHPWPSRVVWAVYQLQQEGVA